jgi:hypothetical protein
MECAYIIVLADALEEAEKMHLKLPLMNNAA